MKAIFKFVFLISISIFFYSCGREVTCKPFDEQYAMFVPNMELNDSITFYSNQGDSLVFTYIIGTKKEEQACDDERECWAALNAIYEHKNGHRIAHLLYYDGNNPSQINVRISFSSMYHHEETYSFYYNPKNKPVTASTTIEDSVLVNDVYYKDVVIRNTHSTSDKVYLDKVYVAKNNGLIMFTIKDSDVVWTINKPTN